VLKEGSVSTADKRTSEEHQVDEDELYPVAGSLGLEDSISSSAALPALVFPKRLWRRTMSDKREQMGIIYESRMSLNVHFDCFQNVGLVELSGVDIHGFGNIQEFRDKLLLERTLRKLKGIVGRRWHGRKHRRRRKTRSDKARYKAGLLSSQ
jgi:hypothetical protein